MKLERSPRGAAFVGVSWWIAAAFVAPIGCSEPDQYPDKVYSCDNPDLWHKDKDGNPDPCHKNDPKVCKDACADLSLSHPVVPVALWLGDGGTRAPACPADLPIVDFNGGMDLLAEHFCPACECGEAVCELGPVRGYSSDMMCSGFVSGVFAPDPTWDGACQATSAFPAHSFNSIALESTILGNAACGGDPMPGPAHIAFPAVWETIGRACRREADEACTAGADCGLRASEVPAGFRSCLRMAGASPDEASCPAGFPEQLVLYADTEDSRDCTPCECSPPAGSTCVASMRLHQEAACADFPMVNNPVDLTQGQCIAAGMGFQVQSISAAWITNEPGKCGAMGGEAIGEVVAVGPEVFCCAAAASE